MSWFHVNRGQRGQSGAAGATLNNCTLMGNSAGDGGGAAGGTLNNCTLAGNSARSRVTAAERFIAT
jgi:hypothetical protein